MDTRKQYAASSPCLNKTAACVNSLHGLSCKALTLHSEPIKLDLIGSQKVKFETSILQWCDCGSNKYALIGQDPLQQESQTYTKFLSVQSGPLVWKKELDIHDQQSKMKAKSCSLSSSALLPSWQSCHTLFSTRDAERIEWTKGRGKTSRVKQDGLNSSKTSQGMLSKLSDSCGLMCRICHSGDEDEQLITPCRCTGTVKYAHQTCILSWISKSGSEICELCKYKFKTRKEKVKYFWKWRFPEVSTKGWLHIGLFVAFATMFLTSITWIAWSRISGAPTAVAERTTEEVKFAYMLNGLFIALALGGLYFDSYKHFKRYFKRWAVLNQHVIVECYSGEESSSINKSRNSQLPQGNVRQSSVSIGEDVTEMVWV